MTDLTTIYITADPQDSDAELRCTDHPDWWSDADGTDLLTAVRNAIEHFRDEHRAHVTGCVCRDRVTDSRCVPHPGIVLTASGGLS